VLRHFPSTTGNFPVGMDVMNEFMRWNRSILLPPKGDNQFLLEKSLFLLWWRLLIHAKLIADNLIFYPIGLTHGEGQPSHVTILAIHLQLSHGPHRIELQIIKSINSTKS
jgi:hypothetical protein